MLSGFLLLSLPLVKGTTQNEHMLLHPLIIETYDVILSEGLIGSTSSYVSVNERFVSIYLSLVS